MFVDEPVVAFVLTPERELILAMLRDALSVAMSKAVTRRLSGTRRFQQWIPSDDRSCALHFLYLRSPWH